MAIQEVTLCRWLFSLFDSCPQQTNMLALPAHTFCDTMMTKETKTALDRWSVICQLKRLLRIFADGGHNPYSCKCVNLLRKPKCFLTLSDLFLESANLRKSQDLCHFSRAGRRANNG